MKRIYPLLIGGLLLGASASHGQILNKLKRAAKDGVQEAVEQRVAHELEKAMQRQTDRYLEQVFGPPSQYEGTGYDYGTIMQSMKMNVETADAYTFKGFTDMEISGTDEKGKDIDPVVFRSFQNSEEQTWAIQMDSDDKDVESTVMIFDQSRNATVLLMEGKKGEKSRMAYSMDWNAMMNAAASMDSVDVSAMNINITKTGNSKEILGYQCDEYEVSSDEFEGTYWASKNPIEGYSSYWSKNNFLFSQQMKTKYEAYMDKMPDGDVLEIDYESKTGDGKTHMRIIEMNTTKGINYQMEDYTNAFDQQQ